MTSILGLNYTILCVLVGLEAVVLRGVLRDALSIKQLYGDKGHRVTSDQLAIGTPAPEFAAPILGTRTTVKSAQLKGRTTILLFLSPSEASSPLYRNVAAGIHALWHKAEGSLYIVCSGHKQPCRQLVLEHRVRGLDGQIPVILDKESRVAKRFLISTTPQAVILDYDARVRRYGRPVSKEEIAEMITRE